MFVKDYIEGFLLEYDHPYENATVLKWINLCESNVFGDTIKRYLVKYYARTLNAFQFALPAGVDFTSVKKVYVNGVRYKKKDVRAYKESRSFWYEDGKLCIYPVCSISDTSYVSGAGEITFATNSIMTTGDEFTFSIGDVILVSGATTAANNKYATVIGKGTKTLSFASGTFTAGADAAAVTIAAPKIKVVYEDVPGTKLLANIATDELLIPDRFIQIYDYFLMGKIAYLAKKFAEAANHNVMYNNAVKEYQDWWEAHRPTSPEDEMIADEDIESNSSTNFDTEA
jgi:hypothetical protein